MRPLILTADYGPVTWSGIGTAVAEQARALARMRGFAGVVLVGGAAGPGVPDPFVRALSARRCPVDPAAFDLVHLHSLALSPLALEIRGRFGLPLIYTAHSLLHRELAGGPAAARWIDVQTAVLRASDHVVFVSHRERADALTRLPELAGRCSVLPNGIRPPEPRPRLRPGRGPIVFAGRFTHGKGFAVFAEIVRRLSGRYRFVAAGGHADATGRAVAAELRENYGGRCRVVGWLPRSGVDALFDRARLVLVPSRYEPFGMTALEAMARGAPVLAAATGGLPEVVTAGSGGRLVSSSEPAAWCRSIERVLRSRRLHRQLSRRGPAHVALRHAPDELARRLVSGVYRPLLAGAAAL